MQQWTSVHVGSVVTGFRIHFFLPLYSPFSAAQPHLSGSYPDRRQLAEVSRGPLIDISVVDLGTVVLSKVDAISRPSVRSRHAIPHMHAVHSIRRDKVIVQQSKAGCLRCCTEFAFHCHQSTVARLPCRLKVAYIWG